MEKNPPNPPKLVEKMRRIINKVTDYTLPDAESDNGKRYLAEPFLELPSRKDFPDYYEVIRRPIDIKKIRTRIKRHDYRSLDELADDFNHMCRNAQTYNVEGSQIYDDSLMLQKVFADIREKVELKEDSLLNASTSSMAVEGEEGDDMVSISLRGVNSLTNVIDFH